jgi:hypothetical protein
MTYVFRFPADTPELTYEALHAYVGKGNGACRAIGTTVEVTDYTGSIFGDMVVLNLYGTQIARIYKDAVTFPVHGHSEQATRNWLVRIVANNGIGFNIWRVARQHKKVRRSFYVIDGDRNRPLEGRSYPCDHAAVAARREQDEKRLAKWRAQGLVPEETRA